MTTCSLFDTDCEFKQTDERARHPYVINVGSLDSLGVHADYSSTLKVLSQLVASKIIV